MIINEVEKITGLTKKAIRLYEVRGLISVNRSVNGYRDYTENDVKRLKQIKLLRSAGVSLPDIKLFFSGILSLNELVEKRKKEIDTDSGLSSEQYAFCNTIAERMASGDASTGEILTENDEAVERELGSLAVGIDIGTTTISAVVIDLDNKEQVEVFSVLHNSYVKNSVFIEQSVQNVIDKTEGLLSFIYKSYQSIVCIGVTGQMHGILYVNAEGEAVSELINWQDKRADAPVRDGKSACELITELTGEDIATGYGLATHYYNMLKGLVPSDAVGFCSIMDYFAMRLCGLKRPVTHISVAASLGLFDMYKNDFMTDKLAAIGIGKEILPSVTSESKVVGQWNNIRVSVAIGDNQASFLGSVKNARQSVLVNIGTGSQISAVGNSEKTEKGIECRPFINGERLLCGSALCGGAAYALIERFFRAYVSFAGLSVASQYSVINDLAERAYSDGEQPIAVNTLFCGTRTEPMRRGSIESIDLNNFTPSALVLGVIHGMCDELCAMYRAVKLEKTHIVASGGAVRNNNTLKRVLKDKFGMDVSISSVKEEAATGAALFSAYACGIIEYGNGFCDYIKYV